MIICITGLPGSGKSTVANLIKQSLAEKRILFQHYTTDWVRSGLYPEFVSDKGKAERDFTPDELEHSYGRLYKLIDELLDSNPELAIITDGTFRKESQRSTLKEVAKRNNNKCFIVKVSTEENILLSRLKKRFENASGSGQASYWAVKNIYEEPAGSDAFLIENNGNLTDLKNEVSRFMDSVVQKVNLKITEKPLASIIIKTKNEERWISSCLAAVFNQDFKNFEVVLVDSGSQDRTLEKAKKFPIKIVNYSGEFKHGKSINLGIRNSTGEYIVLLSGHCIPANSQWLGNLIKEIEPAYVAGVYGRQEPLPFSTDLDKRDLLIAFGLDRKVQTNDTFFHNANSVIKREVWQEIPFNEQVQHIEDRLWAKEVLKRGYKIIYTPQASVYHYHGIHQNANPERAKEVVEIMERLEPKLNNGAVEISKLKVAGVIPVKGEIEYLGGRPLIEYTIKRALESKYLNQIAVTTDNPAIADIARDLGIQFIFIYPPELTDEHIEIGEVLKYAILQFEKMEIIPDIIAYVSPTYPFRPKGLIDEVIKKLMHGGYDSVLPVLPDWRAFFTREESQFKRLDRGYIPSKFKEPLYAGLSGSITASYVDVLKKGEDRLGERVGMVELDNLIYYIDTGKAKGKELAELLIKDWWEKNK